jgi:hypothetical protein
MWVALRIAPQRAISQLLRQFSLGQFSQLRKGGQQGSSVFGLRPWTWHTSNRLVGIIRPNRVEDRADLRSALVTTVQAVPGLLGRFLFAEEVTRRFLLATADADDRNHAILKLSRGTDTAHLRLNAYESTTSRRLVRMKWRSFGPRNVK